MKGFRAPLLFANDLPIICSVQVIRIVIRIAEMRQSDRPHIIAKRWKEGERHKESRGEK